MNYATGAAFNLDEVFENFDMSKLKMNCDLCQKINGNPHRDILVKKIFREAMKLIFDDIIENNVTFQLPTASRKSDIHMLRYSNEDFAEGRRNGKWKDVDFLKSVFTGYQMVLNMYDKDGGVTRTKPIYLDKKRKNRITELTNNGKQYC